MPPLGDHDLLFGATAVDLGFVTHEQVTALAQALDSTPGGLERRLCEARLLTPEDAAAIAAVVQRRLARSAGDARRALESAGVGQWVRPLGNEFPTAAAKHADTAVDRFQTQAATAWSYSLREQRFTVLRLHQQGGLGRLMIAKDGELNREIALKEILPALADNEENRRRFIREAEITGALEHPGVVPVYSLGEFADGRPYYAMRFIRGSDLATAIDEFFSRPARRASRQFEMRQLLGRFVAVCQAVHYAHTRGVLHRDLKPANIMLGDFGETLVVDWGLARMLDEAPRAHETDSTPIRPSERASTDGTQAGRVVGTIPYMSPEQAQGRIDLMTPASDIFGLGATLYHLLTGGPPYDGADRDVMVQVQYARFPPPSDVERGVPKPLEAICLRAMARHPGDRYATALQLGLDVERYLGDERVHAYAEPAIAQAWRWIRRHRTLVLSSMAAATATLIALAVGVALLTAANRREREARRQADANFVEAVSQRERAETNFRLAQDAVQQYYVRVSEDTLLNQPGMQPLRDSLLRQALVYYEKFAEERSDDPQLRREAAAAHFFAGRITETVDSAERALPHYRRAVELQTKWLDSARDDRDLAASEVAQTQNALGRALQRLGRRDEARDHYERAAGLREELAKARPDDVERALALASSVMNLGLLDLADGDARAALPRLEQAQSLRLAHASSPASREGTYRRDLGMGHYNIALALWADRQGDAAERELQRAIAVFEGLARDEPNDLDNRRRLAISRRMIADVQRADGRADEAIDAYARSRDQLKALVERNPEVTEFAADLAGVRMNLGSALAADARYEEALEEMQAAIAGLQALVDRQAAAPSQRRDLAVAFRGAGEVLAALKDPVRARSDFEASRAILESLVREHPAEPAYGAELRQTLAALEKLDAI